MEHDPNLEQQWLHTIVVPWPFQHMYIEKLINFEKFISTHWIFLNIHYFFDFKEIIFENLKFLKII
jgi:hypothetical protein